MLRIAGGKLGFGINGFQSHCPHQPDDALAVNVLVVGKPQFMSNFSGAVKWAVGKDFIHEFHDTNVVGTDRNGSVVEARAGNIQQFSLAGYGQV